MPLFFASSKNASPTFVCRSTPLASFSPYPVSLLADPPYCKAESRMIPGKGTGLVATEYLFAEDLIAAFRLKNALSCRRARSWLACEFDLASFAGNLSPQHAIAAQILLTKTVLRLQDSNIQVTRDRLPTPPCLAPLPSDFLLPVFQPHTDLPSLLLPSSSPDQSLRVAQQFVQEHNWLFASLQSNLAARGHSTLAKALRKGDWDVACSLTFSRVFVHPGTGEHHLVPGADFANHQHPEYNAFVRFVENPELSQGLEALEEVAPLDPGLLAASGEVGVLELRAGADIDPGAEILISYGNKMPEEFLLWYGFVPGA